MSKLSRSIRDAVAQHPRENQRGSGALASLNAEIVVDADGSSTLVLDLRGSFVGTVEVSGQTDDSNWMVIPMKAQPGVGLYVLSATIAGVWMGACAGYTRVRVRMSAYTSGAATATLTSCLGAMAPDQFDATPLFATITAAAGAAATLTIASPGVGLRTYLTYLRIMRFAAAALTPAATPVIVTTTNLPGAMAFSIATDAAAQGTIFDYQEAFNYPIAAVAQATAVTIAAPVTTAAIWRISAGYQVRP